MYIAVSLGAKTLTGLSIYGSRPRYCPAVDPLYDVECVCGLQLAPGPISLPAAFLCQDEADRLAQESGLMADWQSAVAAAVRTHSVQHLQLVYGMSPDPDPMAAPEPRSTDRDWGTGDTFRNAHPNTGATSIPQADLPPVVAACAQGGRQPQAAVPAPAPAPAPPATDRNVLGLAMDERVRRKAVVDEQHAARKHILIQAFAAVSQLELVEAEYVQRQAAQDDMLLEWKGLQLCQTLEATQIKLENHTARRLSLGSAAEGAPLSEPPQRPSPEPVAEGLFPNDLPGRLSVEPAVEKALPSELFSPAASSIPVDTSNVGTEAMAPPTPSSLDSPRQSELPPVRAPSPECTPTSELQALRAELELLESQAPPAPAGAAAGPPPGLVPCQARSPRSAPPPVPGPVYNAPALGPPVAGDGVRRIGPVALVPEPPGAGRRSFVQNLRATTRHYDMAGLAAGPAVLPADPAVRSAAERECRIREVERELTEAESEWCRVRTRTQLWRAPGGVPRPPGGLAAPAPGPVGRHFGRPSSATAPGQVTAAGPGRLVWSAGPAPRPWGWS